MNRSESMPADLLVIKALRKNFNGRQVLKGLDLEFGREPISALIGPNGSGKSTLFDLVTGMLAPDGGDIYWKGRSLLDLPIYRRARLGLGRGFQQVRVISRLTVCDNLLSSGRLQGGEQVMPALLGTEWRRQRRAHEESAFEVAKAVGLADLFRSPAGLLSYGQRKLLSVACVFAGTPSVALLDEPIAGVAPGMAERVVGLFRTAGEGGSIIIFIEHDLGFVREIADSVFVLSCGEIVEEGTTMAVLEAEKTIAAFHGQRG